MTMDEFPKKKIQWMLAVSAFLSFLALVLPFLPPHTAPLVLVASLVVGVFWVYGIPLIQSLFPDRDEFTPEQTREEKLQEQYATGEISFEEFEQQLDDLELLETEREDEP